VEVLEEIKMKTSAVLKDIFYQSRIPQMISTADFKKTDINQAFCEFIGYTRDEWSALSVEDISHPDDFKQDLELLQGVLDGCRMEYRMEKRYIHKTGVIKWGLLNVSVIKDDETKESYLLGQIIDITDKKHMEEAVKKSEQKYRLLAEHISDIIMLHQVDGTYLYVSPSVQAVIGYSPAEMVGNNPFTYIHEEDMFRVRQSHRQMLTRGEPVLVTYRTKRKDGSHVWLETAIKAIYDEQTGKLSELVSVSRDVQKRKETDELLRRSEKLAVVGEMAAAVAHEIRNPLTSIKGFMQLSASTREYNERYSTIVLAELQRVETIISEFLTLAKPHSGWEMETVLMLEIIEQVIQLVQTEALLENKEITFQALTPVCAIRGNVNSLKQVLINVIQNGLDATAKKGKITVEAFMHEHGVCIRVQDNGCGIPKSRLDKLGEPFYSTKEKGTGLGLMTSFKIIENHNGQIHIESEEGKGTTVSIHLPCQG
jgi:two-component system sporulation sensor kinase A